MSNSSKNEEDKLTTNESSREITLAQVVGGMGPILYSWFRGTSCPCFDMFTASKSIDTA
jgi:hypothetical protein